MKISARYLVEKANKDGSVRRYWQRPGFPTKRLADELPEALRSVEQLNKWADGEVEREGVETGPKAGTVAWAIKLYRESDRWAGLASNTRKRYERWMLKLEAKQGHRHLSTFDEAAVDEILHGIQSPGGKIHCAAVLSQIGKIAHRRRYRPTNPATRLELKRGTPRQEIWSREDEAAFLEACEGEKHEAALRLCLLMLVDTAQRPGDVLRLTWANYDGTAIRLTQQKTGTKVEVDCTKRLKEALGAAKATRTGTVVVAGPNGQRFQDGTFRRAFKVVCKKAGIEGLQARDLRRTAVVRMAEAGALPHEIAAVTGHSLDQTMRILETYLPRTTKMQRAAIAKLERSK